METIISSRRIEWMRRIVSQLFHDETSSIGEMQQTRRFGRNNRRRKVAHDDSSSNNSTYKTTQINTTTLRYSAWTALPVAMGNESFNWESCLEYNLRSPLMNSKETATSRNPKSKSKGEKKPTLSALSASSSRRVSCFLAFLGTSLIIISLCVTVNPFANPISQLQMKMQPTIEDTETGTGTSSLPIDTLTRLFLRATGICVLFHSTLGLFLPMQLLQTSKVALLYGMAVLAAGQAFTSHAIRIPCGGIAMVFWFLAGWESWATWETPTNTATRPLRPRSKSKSKSPTNPTSSKKDNTEDILLQYLADDVAQTVFAVTVPLLIATLGVPHTVMEFLLQQFTQQPVDKDEDEWFTTTLLLSIRLFGICQFAFVVLMMDWKDQIPKGSRPHHSLFLWLPLAQLVLVNLPLFLSLLLTLEDIRLGAFLVIAQVGVGVWVIFRTIGTIQYTQSHLT